jgi:hypothetical protein
MMMGSLSKQTTDTNMLQNAGSSNEMLDMLGGLLDADNDGSVVDDILGMASKFLR